VIPDERSTWGCVGASQDRRTFLRCSVLAAGAIGGGAVGASVGLGALVAAAAAGPDVQMLQTAAALENLAVAAYTTVLGLPESRTGASIPVVKSFITMTMDHHRQHAQAYNAAAQALGGMAQNGVDRTVNDTVVTPAVARITGPADVMRLAITLEDTAAATYIKFGAAAAEAAALKLFATVAPVEAQHSAVLRALAALLAAGLPQLVVLGPDASKLPAASGAAGFPASFFRTSPARPPAEGALPG
jgi:rubrerythrin